MIMPPGRHLLLPANPRFVALTLLGAVLLQMLMGLSEQAWLPDVLLLTLVFWSIHQPRRVGMFTAFLLGLCMDVHESTLLGHNALAYVCATFFAGRVHRRVLSFSVQQQALQVLPVFVLGALIKWLIPLVTDGVWPHGLQCLGLVLQLALWPVFSHLLLSPQRRPPDRDDIRPL